ncbi:structural maintenance of chromosomes protein 2 [Chelonus insularis]|uniref:structural maintenance of chromosomes protein 2 n=1 Tax=Chelonus insularis TaxID=460826 RepID=UPI00158C530A|nr:structural maintenance of chromosomes protein 2 [Chelonus insularis]
MYVKSLVLDGFKSYGKRAEINGFDREFNAITGLNGSGKSNILDGICFVLGISALGQVRATSLQELVYKSGQAGIKKASVTITFDNTDKSTSPIGYESSEEITVTRQIVINGKNKYFINGTSVTNKRVQDMFCSVQLNVNNPHFLIMQGRITKVLNMKPLEILSMIEEAAGTRMFEEKKEVAIKTIEKKNNRLQEINSILEEDIAPKLAKLKEDKAQYIEYQKVQRELEHYVKIVVAWDYVSALKNSEKATANVEKVKNEISEKNAAIEAGKEEIASIDTKIEEMKTKLHAEKQDRLEQLEQEIKAAEKKENKMSAESNSNRESIKAEKKNIDQLKINITEDEKMLEQKETELQNVGGKFDKLKETEQQDAAAVVAAQEKLQKISAGLLESDTGENATLEQQLINVKHLVSQAQTEIKQCEMALNHNRDLLKKKQKEAQMTDNDYRKDNRDLEEKKKQLNILENQMKNINYEDGTLQRLQQTKRTLVEEIQVLQDKIESFVMKYPRLRFEYQDPTPNFDRNSVKGLACTQFNLKDKKAAYALDVAAGDRLYNVVVDSETIGKALLKKGQLQQRVTFIPLNKISGKTIDNSTLQLAQNLVGKENVQTALSFIEYNENVSPAMKWIFGQTLICKDINIAKQVAFHERIMKRCVTLEGDTCDPSGVLSGGAASKTGSILLLIDAYKSLQNELKHKEEELKTIERQISQVAKTAERYSAVKQQFDLKTHEVNLLKQKLEQTTYHKLQEEINSLQQKIREDEEKMTAAKNTEKENTKRSKELESQLKDSANIRDKQLKNIENQLKVLQKKAENSRKEWQKYEHSAETLDLEIKELKKSIEAGKEQLEKALEKLKSLEEKDKSYEEQLIASQEYICQLQENLKTHKNLINQQNKEIQKFIQRKEEIAKQRTEFELDIKKLNHEVNTITNSAAECKQRVKELIRKHPWIEEDEAYFGEPNGRYDFQKHDPAQMMQKKIRAEALRDELSRNVNARAMNLLTKEEERYNDIVKKKNIVLADKKKILDTIARLEEKKKEVLVQAWEQVNRDFDSIFSSLLPGANAKLQTTDTKNVLDGLEVKVGFSGVWKESLGELSGGQRSLVALSLILAMLLFKPAPLYILDEVDAALDLSHTQNIGTMLKRHFRHSQFIIVSLKDGMFDNANVLFTTQFVDGMSTVSRAEKVKNKHDHRK